MPTQHVKTGHALTASNSTSETGSSVSRLVGMATDNLQDMQVRCSTIFNKQKQEPPKYLITGS